MPHYSFKFKEAIIKKYVNSDLSMRGFSRQEGISLSTLCGWQKKYQVEGRCVSKVSNSGQWSTEEKFSVVLETSTLSEVELSEYCRTKGL
jgi:transposase